MKSAYTDAPELHPNLVLGSLHLLAWFFVHPSAWRNHLSRIDPTLPPNFTLAELTRTQWANRALRRLLIQGYVVLPLLVGLAVALTLWGRGATIETITTPLAYVVMLNLALGLMMAAVIGTATGIVGGTAVGVAVGIVGSLGLAGESAADVIVATAISVAVGLAGSVAANLVHPKNTLDKHRTGTGMQAGAIIIGLLVGVGAVELMRFGLTTLGNLTIGLSENAMYWSSRALVVGVSFGMAMGWRHSVKIGVIGGLAGGLVYGLAAGGLQTQFSGWPDFLVESGLALGLTSGLLFGTSFGVTMGLPYVLAEGIAGVWAGAWAGALGSWSRHVFRNEISLWPALPLGFVGVSLGLTLTWWRPILFYPLVGAWNLSLYRLDQRWIGRRPSLLRWHSAFWDELQRLPLTGLDEHLLLVMERSAEEGQAALAYLGQSSQRWAAQSAQIELEARRLEGVKEVHELGSVFDRMAQGELAGPASALLRQFSHLSRDVAAALNQVTAYHQRLALKTIEDRLNTLARELTVSSEPYAARFYPIVANWQQLVGHYSDHLAEEVERSQEIDNPYVVGVPLTEQQEIFVGRTDIVARIEQLLPDRRRPALLLYGQRRMGKTSLLRNLGRLLPRTVVPLFVDGQRISLASDYPDFLYNLAGEMSRSAQKQRGLPFPALSRENLALHPFTYFNEWLDKVERTLQSQGYQVALLALDEFEVLNSVLHKGRFDETDVLSLLRHMIQHRPQFKVMLAGSHPLEEFQNWASYLINVQVVKIEYLALDEARQLIESPVKDFVLRYDPEAVKRILEITRGHPALIQLLCYEIVLLKNEQDRALRRLVCLADVVATVPKALTSGSFFFSDIQQNQIDGAGLVILRFMAGCGEGALVSRVRLAGLALPDLEQALALLVQRDLLEAVNGSYRFQVELIRRWFEQI